MCGIAGLFDPIRPPTLDQLHAMVAIQTHRGPDGHGEWLDGPVALGMRRLAIIDIAGGDQPIFNEDHSVAVVFNGEIYNYLELRKDLLSKGHTLRTRGDTEVLVHLYEDLGPAMLPLLNGMFAFAIWDARRRRIFLARDRMGVKPLYYAQRGGRWFFASELKCLLTQPEIRRALDLDADALADFLRLSYIPRDRTPYRGIYKLLPGHSMMIEPGRELRQRWWDLADQPDRPPKPRPEELEALFGDAVRLRMRSDVPVASFLSGGLDSSLVTIVAQDQSPIPITSFTLGFEHTEFDETPYARAVATHASTRHREAVSTPGDALRLLPLLQWHLDEPLGDSSIIPNFLISRFAARHVKVCLSGLGGDELFGGYARYQDPGIGRIRRLFAPMPSAAALLAPWIGRFHYSWGEELRLSTGPGASWRSYLHRLQIFHTRALQDVGFPALGSAESLVHDLWNRYPGSDPVSRRQFVDQHTYLPDQILALTDRMSMANALEVRVPFMDYRLVRLSQSLSSCNKQTPRDFKIFLKKALGAKCPPEILTRPKWGFDTPLARWVAQPDLFAAIRQLDTGEGVRAGLLRPQGVRALTRTPEAARHAARRVWNLLMLDVWLRVHLRPTPPTETLDELIREPACVH